MHNDVLFLFTILAGCFTLFGVTLAIALHLAANWAQRRHDRHWPHVTRISDEEWVRIVTTTPPASFEPPIFEDDPVVQPSLFEQDPPAVIDITPVAFDQDEEEAV